MWGLERGRSDIQTGRRRDALEEFISHLQIINGLFMWGRIRLFIFLYIFAFHVFLPKGFEVMKKYSKSTLSSFGSQT